VEELSPSVDESIPMLSQYHWSKTVL
jgi:hypothetical protein